MQYAEIKHCKEMLNCVDFKLKATRNNNRGKDVQARIVIYSSNCFHSESLGIQICLGFFYFLNHPKNALIKAYYLILFYFTASCKSL